jgi:hypothetical protein
MVSDRCSRIKVAQLRRQEAKTGIAEIFRQDRNEEMDLWPDDAPCVEIAHDRLMKVIEQTRAAPVIVFRAEAA